MKNLILSALLCLCFTACKTAKLHKLLHEQNTDQHLGVLITDTKTGKILFSHNHSKNFVPASNTKILTLYSCLSTLGDSLPAFRYFVKSDTTFLLGTGDPTLLHPDFPASAALQTLQSAKVLVISSQNINQPHFGPGWAWDDYNDYYQPELSSFPIYGNVIRINQSTQELKLSPEYFRHYLKDSVSNQQNIVRELNTNTFYYNPNISRKTTFRQEVPFKTGMDLTAQLLSESTGKPVIHQNFEITQELKTAYSLPIDTVLRKMMQESDNLLAEQLLLVAGSTISDTLSSAQAIKNMASKILSQYPNLYSWRDGSGLSRYNLLSPDLMVYVLNKMYSEFPQERLFSMMSIGGKAGTLRNKYKAENPYVFAKTGSMSGVYNESGYLISKSGRLLTYSVMKNNFTGSVAKNGKETMEFINKIRSAY